MTEYFTLFYCFILLLNFEINFLPASWLSVAFSDTDLMLQFCLPYRNHRTLDGLAGHNMSTILYSGYECVWGPNYVVVLKTKNRYCGYFFA